MLAYVSQDFIQSAVAMQVLATEGMLSSSKRELRFVLEAGIKLARVQQQYTADIPTKLESFRRDLNSPSISMKNRLDLTLIDESQRSEFLVEVGRVYGEMSNFVHLTVPQIQAQVAAVNAGRTAGRESPDDVQAFVGLLQRGLACSLVFLLHSVPSYVAGDWLVETDGSTVESYYTQSRWIAAIDAHFDYKHERQAKLAEIRETRERRVKF